jgi:hypothetical protein
LLVTIIKQKVLDLQTNIRLKGHLINWTTDTKESTIVFVLYKLMPKINRIFLKQKLKIKMLLYYLQLIL